MRFLVKRGKVKPKAILLTFFASLSVLSAVSLYPRTSNSSAVEGEQTQHLTSSTFTIIALPDTQKYADSHPHIFESQIEWILDNLEEKNIVFVSHLGDVVDDATDRNQWRTAESALSKLDSKVPYAIATGNHDMEPDGSAFYLNHYFPVSKFEKHDWWGDSFQADTSDLPIGQTKGIKNSYQKLTIGDSKLLLVHLEYCPPNEVLDWAHSVIKQHPDHRTFVATHAFINGFSSRKDTRHPKCYHHAEGKNDGEDIWQKLIVDGNNENIALFMNGHFSNPQGSIRRTDTHNGKRIHQLFSNYQQWKNGGNGYLRIMTFDTQQNTLEVKTYSPFLKKYLKDPQNNFILDM